MGDARQSDVSAKGRTSGTISPMPRWVAPVVVIALALLIQASGGMFGDYASRVMLDTGIMMIAAVSLTIVNGFTGQFSIGHAAFMAIGGYVSGWLTYYGLLSTIGRTTELSGAHGWLLLPAAIVGGLVAAGAGWLVGLPSLRLRGDYLAIVTLGFGEILRVLLQQTDGQRFSQQEMSEAGLFGLLFPPDVGGASGFESIPKLTNLAWVYLMVGVVIVFAIRLKYSSYGRAMLAIREDEIAAESMGVNVTRMKVRAFMFAAFFAGVAGTLYAHQPGTLLRPADAGYARSFDIVIMVVMGGLGSISGATLAAVLVSLLNVGLLELADYGAMKWRMPIFALLLILIMIFRPQGLFGLREIWDFFTSRDRVRGKP